MDCSQISAEDVQTLCMGLSAELSSLQANPRWVAAITGLSATVGALLSAAAHGYFTRRTNAKSSRLDIQKSSIFALQDKAKDIRRHGNQRIGWLGSGAEGDDPYPAQEFISDWDEFQILAARIQSDAIREKADQWQAIARKFFIGYEATEGEPITRAAEGLHWNRLVHATREELLTLTR